MAKMIKWPEIGQYRNAVHNVVHSAHYVGKDSNGDPIYDTSRKAPVLKYEGTVKLHGTNASVAYTPDVMDQDMWCQSRENIITVEKDNAGFAMFVKANEEFFATLVLHAYSQFDFTTRMSNNHCAVFGEWCGKGIQDTVAIAQLPKMFVVFGMALVNEEGDKTYATRDMVEDAMTETLQVQLKQHPKDGVPNGIYCIYDFPTFKMEIDFGKPHESQNMLNEITQQVEAECPVAKQFGVVGLGEGVVWRCTSEGYEDSGYWFKVKGAKHSKSKVKTNATVDVERINNIIQLSETLAHEGRLAQMYQQVFDTLNGGEPDIKRTGDFIKAVMQDILKEEIDVIAASGFTTKDITGYVSKIARDYLMKQLEL